MQKFTRKASCLASLRGLRDDIRAQTCLESGQESAWGGWRSGRPLDRCKNATSVRLRPDVVEEERMEAGRQADGLARGMYSARYECVLSRMELANLALRDL
jgi:hypothetical protein